MDTGTIDIRCKLDTITAKGNGTTDVKLVLTDDYVTPEDVADLYRMRGKSVAVRIVDPEQPLPLEYEDAEPEVEVTAGLALVE